MFVLESVEKRSILLDPFRKLSRETTSSTLSRSVFFWLNPLFARGYKHNLSLEDTYPLDPKLDSEALYHALACEWDKGISKFLPY